MMRIFKSFSLFSFRFSDLKLLVPLFPFLIIIVAYILYRKDPFLLVSPDKNNQHQTFMLEAFDDRHQYGKSKAVVLENTGNKLSYGYTLHDTFLNPYAGVQYIPGEGQFFDLSAYDYLKLKIKASQGKSITIGIGTHIELDDPSKSGFVYVEKGILKAFRIMSALIHTDTQYQELIIPVKQLATPDWWYVDAKVGEQEVSSPDYSKVKYIHFGHCIAIRPGVEDIVEMEEVGFYKDYKGFYTGSVIGLLGYFALAGLFFYKRKKAVEINFRHGKLTSGVPFTKEEESVFGCITSRYMNQELSIAEIQKESGYSEHKIAEIIKAKAGMNFKPFLNKLRISEAKRLLLETDFTISEIAEKVGYGNVAHFNRVFKALEGNAPNEFKKQNKALSFQKEKTVS